MKPAPFEFISATSEDQAIAALAQRPSTVLAGGQTLLPLMNRRIVRPQSLVDISRVDQWSSMRVNDRLSIGAAVTQHAVECDGDVRARAPIVAAAVSHVATLPVRVRGTWVGSLAYADPCAEIPMVAALLDGQIEVVSSVGARLVAYREYLRGGDERLAAGEIIRGFAGVVPSWANGWGFHEISARQNDRAIAAAAVLTHHTGGVVSRCSAALCGEAFGQVWMDTGSVHLTAQQLDTALADWLATLRRDAADVEREVAQPYTFGRAYSVGAAGTALARAARAAVGTSAA